MNNKMTQSDQEILKSVVSEVYLRFFGRHPDSDALLWYETELEKGRDGISLVIDMMGSDEYKTKWTTLLESSATQFKNDKVKRLVQVFSEVHLRFFDRLPTIEALGWYESQFLNGQSFLSIVGELIDTTEYNQRSKHKLFVSPGHYYSPIVNVEEVLSEIDRKGHLAMPSQLHGICIDRKGMISLWQRIGATMRDAESVPSHANPRYTPHNPNFSAADALVWQGMLRLLEPKRVIEVGSGWSSALLLDTVETYFSHQIDLTFVEPYPELLLSLLGDKSDWITIVASPVQSCDIKIFEALKSGDVLFIDSTHILKTGSDVVYELFEVLPSLSAGVYVHFHDVFWPFEYPRGWVIDDNRSWNELYALRAYLMDNPTWEIVFFNDYMAKTAVNEITQFYENFNGRLGGSLYLRKR